MRLLLLFAAALSLTTSALPASPPTIDAPAALASARGKWDRKLARLFQNGTSEVWVSCKGTVVYKLPDDLEGSRHQRFLLKLRSGQTVLIVHNIDLVKRVKPLRIGHGVTVRGEYIWNDKGGLIHYTHHDPLGLKPGGWIKHKGRLYR